MRRILMVDDDKEMCEELCAALESAQHTVDVVNDGNKAISSIEQTEYALVLLDLKMSGINGYEVLTYIKKTHPMMKVLVLTGSYLKQKYFKEEDQVFPCGEDILALADEMITKPFNMEDVLLKIDALIQG